MIVLDVVQGEPEWEGAKLGIPSASVIEKIYTSTGKISGQREALLQKLARERILKKPEHSYKSQAMKNGNDTESEARSYFELITGLEVEQVGLCYYDERKDRICSPDGLIVGTKEGLEIKCPEFAAHYDYVKAGVLPTKYFVQVQSSLYVTGYEKWHFLSYYPGLKHLHVEVERDEIWIAKCGKAIDDFVVDLDELYNEMKKLLIEEGE